MTTDGSRPEEVAAAADVRAFESCCTEGVAIFAANSAITRSVIARIFVQCITGSPRDPSVEVQSLFPLLRITRIGRKNCNVFERNSVGEPGGWKNGQGILETTWLCYSWSPVSDGRPPTRIVWGQDPPFATSLSCCGPGALGTRARWIS